MRRKFIFKDDKQGYEVTLPVTPESYEITNGIKVEKININSIGEVNFAGNETLSSIKINCCFPAKAHPYENGEHIRPEYFVQCLDNWRMVRRVLRFVISGTIVNESVIVSSISYGERDGTGDIHATITLEKYRYLQPQVVAVSENSTRPPAAPEPSSNVLREHTVVSGDTLYYIARKYYGNGSYYQKLADFNNIKNPNIIRDGQKIKIPEISQL